MIVHGLIYTAFNFKANFGQHVILDKSQLQVGKKLFGHVEKTV